MLPVFHTSPGTSPSESMGFEETVGQVGRRYLTREVGRAVDIPCCRGRLYGDTSGTRAAVAGVVEGVQVHGHTARVGGEPAAAFHHTVAEGTGVIGTHRQLIVGPKVINEPYALDRISVKVELSKNIKDVDSNGLVTNHLAKPNMPLEVFMQQAEIAKIRAANGAALWVAFALHTSEDCIRYRGRGEAARQPIGLHSLDGDNSTGSPCGKRGSGRCCDSEEKKKEGEE